MQKYLFFPAGYFLFFGDVFSTKKAYLKTERSQPVYTHTHHCYIAYQVQLVMLKQSGAPEYTALTLSPPISQLVSALGQYNFPYDWLVQIVLCGLGSSLFCLCSFCFAVEHWMIHQWCDTCPSSRLAWNNLRRLCVT